MSSSKKRTELPDSDGREGEDILRRNRNTQEKIAGDRRPADRITVSRSPAEPRAGFTIMWFCDAMLSI